MTHQEQLIAWLNDAYSMEKGIVPVLKNHASDAKDFPEIQQRNLQHMEETERHAVLVQQCIEQLGGTVSPVKALVGGITGMMNSVVTGPFKDELVKNFLTDYAAEHFEIASYLALIAAAREYGETRVVDTCEQILRDEQAMAEWIESYLPMAVHAFMGQSVAALA